MITPAYSPTATERVLPRLALDFTTASLDSRVTVTRALNTATCVNSSGYIQIVNANLPRFDYDPITKVCKGLLIEESRANLQTYSDQFNGPSWNPTGASISPDVVTSPDGTVNADKLVENTSNSAHQIPSLIGMTSGTPQVFSFYAKKAERSKISFAGGGFGGQGFNTIWDLDAGTVSTNVGGKGSIVSAGDGWYRCIVAFTPSNGIGAILNMCDASGSTIYTGDGTSGLYLYGAQLEAGAFATSYIPTTTTSLTRNTDVVTMTGTNFSSWYNATEGAVFCQFYRSDTTGASRGAWSIRDAANTGMDYRPYASQVLVQIGGVTQADIYPGGGSANSVVKSCFTYKVDSFAASTNAGNPATDTLGNVPTVTQMFIGALSAATGQVLCGHMQKLFYWPQRVTNAEVRAFSK